MRISKKRLAVSGMIVAICAAGVIGWAVYASIEPKPKTEERKDIMAFIASDDFKKLSSARQNYYLEKLRGAETGPAGFRAMRESMENLTEAERRTVMDNLRKIRERQMAREALGYLKMNQAERDAFLDKRIAEMETRRAEWEKRRANGEAPRGGRGARPAAPAAANAASAAQTAASQTPAPQRPTEEERNTMMKTRMESQLPEVRAAMQLMHMDMMKKMAGRRR
ncbi:MAG: hypothetical protein PHI35_03990 [Victivallaceae bacterium]|nr:hypothetical protein [Victivallaceae bacterium]